MEQAPILYDSVSNGTAQGFSMASNFSGSLPTQFGFWGGLGIALLVIWIVVWKGLALWKAARLERKWWFIALLVINTWGILEIIYYFLIDNKRKVCSCADKTNCLCVPKTIEEVEKDVDSLGRIMKKAKGMVKIFKKNK